MTPQNDTQDDKDLPFLHAAEDDSQILSLHFDFPTIQSSMHKSDPDKLVLDYTRTMMGFLLFQPRPKRILMIGLGGGSLAKYCRRTLSNSDFTALEINPAVIALREQFGIPADGPHFRVIEGDGAAYLSRQAEQGEAPFDVILVDGFDRNGQPAALCSVAFYQSAYAQLNAGGVLAINLCANDHENRYRCSRYLSRVGKAFGEKILVVNAADGNNKIVFAGKGGSFMPSLDKLMERLPGLELAHPLILQETLQEILRQGQLDNARKPTHGTFKRAPKRARP
ncbi:MAG: transferase [Pseudomonadota bacterium]